MSDEKNLIKEINDEIRQDNYQRIWDKYKKYIFIFISLLLVSVASINFYKNYKVKKIEEQSELFFQSIEYIKKDEYKKAEDILKNINKKRIGGFSDLSYLSIIDLNNKKKTSIDLDNLELSKNSLLYDFIILQKFNFQIESNAPNYDIDEILDLSKPSSPWKYTAHELLAAYYIKKKEIDKAFQSLEAIISDENSPFFMKERARIISEKLKENK